VGFALTGALLTLNLYQFRLLDLVPIARDALIENMSDGVLVLDAEDRIVDLNPAAQQVIGRPAATVIGQTGARVLSDWPDLVARYHDVTEAHAEIALGDSEARRTFDLRISPLHDRHDRLTGRLVVLRDITERQRAGEERKRLLTAEREQRLLAETLRDMTLALTSQISHEAVLDEILRQTGRIVPHSTANIALLEDDVLHIARWQGYDAFGTETFIAKLKQPLADLPLNAEIVQSRKPVAISDTQQEPRWVTHDQTAWIMSCLIVPICLRDQVLGLLRLDSDTPGPVLGRGCPTAASPGQRRRHRYRERQAVRVRAQAQCGTRSPASSRPAPDLHPGAAADPEDDSRPRPQGGSR